MTNDIPEQPAAPPQPTTPPAEPAPDKPTKRPGPLAAGLIGLAVGAGIVGASWAITANNGPDTPTTFTLTGTFSLTEDAVALDDSCHGTGGYDDIGTGTSVTVYGAKGDVVATGQLGGGKETGFGACDFTVSVPDVPRGEKFYKVEVSHRGTLQLTAEEAEGGEFAGSLG